MNYRFPILGIVLAILASSGTVRAQELTPEQRSELTSIGLEFVQRGSRVENMIQGKMTELAQELKRDGRLDNELTAAESAKNASVILKDLSGLYGQYIKIKVEFVLAAKNVLTSKQKLHLLSQLRPQETLPFDTVEYMQPEVFDLPLNLSLDQQKQLVSLKAALMVKEVELDRDVAFVLLDLENILLSGESNPEKVDPLVLSLATLAGKEIDNRVDFFLKAKDVLTLDQKRLLVYMLGLD
jgi:hypothetical protein